VFPVNPETSVTGSGYTVARPTPQPLLDLGTGALNIFGGLGSFLQGDLIGGIPVAAGYALAAGLVATELFVVEPHVPGANWSGNIGLGIAGAAVAWGFAWPYIRSYINSRDQGVSAALDRVNLSVEPDANGTSAVNLSYELSF
jgi:hypothetical protein